MTEVSVAGLSRVTAIGLGGVVVAGVLADILAKLAARALLPPYEPVAVLPGFNLALGFNPGVAFGLFPAGSTFGFAAMVALQAILVAGLGFMLFRTSNLLAQFCLAAILAGALGNLTDRIANGAVTDYLDFYLGRWHWPAFNLADILITAGATGLIAQEFLASRRSASR